MPSTRAPGQGYKSSAVDTSANVMRSATTNGTIGNGHRWMNKAACKLGKGEAEFPLSKESLPTRSDKFWGTISSFTKGGACAGAAVGTVALAPVDLFVGQGRERDQGEKGNILDKGLIGHGFEGLTTGASFATEMVGAGIGGAAALASTPAALTSNKGYSEYLMSGVQHGGTTGGILGAHVVGTPAGLALDAGRGATLAVKGTLAVVGAVISAPVGFVVGTFRAIFNV